MRILLALLLASALAACDRGPKTSFRTEPVTRGSIAEVVSATGEVSAVVTVNVGSQVSGTVSRLYADYNSLVKKGQVLADLDPRLFDAALARAEAALAAADADVEKAKAALAESTRAEGRMVELGKKQLASQAEVETAQAARQSDAAALGAAKARVLQARADRDTAKTNLELARIRSPIDGIVISRSVDVGQTVAAAFQAPTLFLIAADLSSMQVLAHVDEADVGKVKPGMRARFTVDAYPGQTFEGKISDLRQAPSTIQNVVTYTAVIDAANPRHELRQGMTAQVSVTTSDRPDALRVANAALRWRPQGDAAPGAGGGGGGAGGAERRGGNGGQGGTHERGGPPQARADAQPEAHTDAPDPAAEAAAQRPQRPAGRDGRVYKLEGGKPVAVRVSTGISDGRLSEVLSGLADGDQVIVGDSSSAGAAPASGPRRGPF